MNAAALLRLGLVSALLIPSAAFSQQRIFLGTSAPAGSDWHDSLLELAQDWKKVSEGKITVTLFMGGVKGSEADMVRKVRFGELQAIAISGAGLPEIDRSIQCLGIPMMLESDQELDYVLERMRGTLEARLAAKGFLVLHWADAGWVRFFTKKPAKTLAEVKNMKLFTSAGDPEAEKLYREFGFRPIPMPSKDLNDSLLRGLIDAFDVPPLFALANQTWGLARNMIDVKWAPLVAATLISKKTWETIPEALRPKLLDAAKRTEARSRVPIRKLEQNAIASMTKMGLNVVQPDPATLADWRAQAEASWPKMRGVVVPDDVFVEVKRLRDEFRAAAKGSRK